MNLETFLRNRLVDGGWVIKRTKGKHQVWCHPNGAIYILPFNMADYGKRKINCLKNIERLERS